MRETESLRGQLYSVSVCERESVLHVSVILYVQERALWVSAMLYVCDTESLTGQCYTICVRELYELVLCVSVLVSIVLLYFSTLFQLFPYHLD